MQYVKYFQCTECGSTYDTTEPMNLCPRDNRPVRLVLDIALIKQDYPDMSWYRPDEKSMWRFGPLLPFNKATQPDKVVSLGEGFTPVIDISDFPLCQSLSLNVAVKDEGQPYEGYGANPTGSFKDRGMSMVATMAKHYGLEKLTVPTQGNAGDSLTAYGLSLDKRVAVVMPDDTPLNIMGSVAVAALKHDNISIDLVKGTIREAGEFMKEHYVPDGFFNCATFQEPGWRIEGKKTMGLELAEPWPGLKDEWGLPDVVFYPTGGGTGILGMWKAFDELEAMGIIDHHRPRIIAVQSENNTPIVHAIEHDLDDTIPTDGGDTIATGINVPGGVGHKAVLAILRASEGSAIAVSEKAISDISRAIFTQYKMWISPEGAACIGALEEAKAKGLVASTDRIVCFNTGSAEKYLDNLHDIFMQKQTVST
ncbi:threonine synthase [Alteromonas sp. ASW11-36]|uniref:Threonine synthase n=1 Tax=Alteromonas arenosi TaxID=3055817 RepID=A0ABT7SW09_9ALTE|nr:threonine synthase [Alteromonas sp. ASW11-36]MDM7860380.1 threonine synthase [Alteromonas sp. ASW11-36]